VTFLSIGRDGTGFGIRFRGENGHHIYPSASYLSDLPTGSWMTTGVTGLSIGSWPGALPPETAPGTPVVFPPPLLSEGEESSADTTCEFYWQQCLRLFSVLSRRYVLGDLWI
jgi:hypothetical protein